MQFACSHYTLCVSVSDDNLLIYRNFLRVEAGARAVVQPGGSNRDEEVIEAADRLGIAMVFTGVRHFRH